MNKTIKKISLLTLAGALAALTFSACDKGTDPAPTPTYPDSLYVKASVLRAYGDTVFHSNCSGCHGENGEGGRGPELKNSDFVMNHRQVVMNLVLRGNVSVPPYLDTLVVNGRVILGGGMPAWHDVLSNRDIAAALTYVRSVLNDSTVTNCTGGDNSVCTKTARTPSAMAADTVAVWEVKAVRDSLQAKGVFNQ